ncbi:hypothetical protein INR49_030452 [Caranx melampygus]|nr:hypothetical protein INR49_030452 [Caranx melampygus]
MSQKPLLLPVDNSEAIFSSSSSMFLLLRLLLPGPELVGAASSCPSLCTCSNQASRVICTRQNLEQVPESISVNTRYLNLQENSIQVFSVKLKLCEKTEERGGGNEERKKAGEKK